MQNLQLILSIASTKQLIIRALKIALVVGIILNFINQGEKLIILDFQNINLFKFFLTFTVPFCVSMYTAITMKLKFHVGEKAVDNAILRCTSCNSCLEVKKEQVIPFCDNCNEKTQWKISSIKDKKCQHKK
ncbi:nitrate/nitrite transporter NrtS [Arcobacter sp. LA11]|uniref:nitrate/nitrite transporter NrtS n=1 Tax=Arcobacter sp. LA11 TaxID=1898176 RepID=UPI001160A18C|nr:nitrate/nitrite transporter NrtS [Arcobacter sp. LA11]